MEYNPYAYEMHADPYPTYRWMRDEAPVYHNEAIGFWALTRFSDVWAATLDWETFSSSAGPMIEMEKPDIPMMIAMDPPEHATMRGIVSKAFTPRRIAELEPKILEIVTGLLDPLVERGAFDAVKDFSAKFPMDVISTLLGIPAGDRDMVRIWSNEGLHREPGSKEIPASATDAMQQMGRYFFEAIEERRRQPRDDLMTALTQAELEDERGEKRRLDDLQLLGFCLLIAAAGNETVTKFFGNAVVHLARSPEQRRLLVEDPSLTPNAVEEILRFDPPSQYQGRITLREATLHGRTIPAGERVILLTGAACRDEREYEQPDLLDVRRHIDRHLALGWGRHVCLGASLARLEGRISLAEFLRRFPAYQVDEDGIELVHSSNVKGFSGVPVRP